MAGLALQPIRVALAAQIAAYLERPTSVHPYEHGDYRRPAIIIRDRPGDDQIEYFSTMGGAGYADVWFELTLEVSAGQLASALIAMDDYKSVGTGNLSSVVDAIHSDRTLGGLVADCTCLAASAADLDTDPITCTFPVRVIVKKIGANP